MHNSKNLQKLKNMCVPPLFKANVYEGKCPVKQTARARTVCIP